MPFFKKQISINIASTINNIKYTKYINAHLLVLFVDDFWLLVPLEPHHVLGVKPPALLLQCLGSQVLALRALHVVKYKEQCLRGQTLEEVNSIRVRKLRLQKQTIIFKNLSSKKTTTIKQNYLLIIGRRLTVVPWQILSESLRVRWMRHVIVGSLHHLELQLMLLLQRHRAEGRYAQQRRNVCFGGGCC